MSLSRLNMEQNPILPQHPDSSSGAARVNFPEMDTATSTTKASAWDALISQAENRLEARQRRWEYVQRELERIRKGLRMTEFYLFPQLPRELRDMVWKWALPRGRIVRLGKFSSHDPSVSDGCFRKCRAGWWQIVKAKGTSWWEGEPTWDRVCPQVCELKPAQEPVPHWSTCRDSRVIAQKYFEQAFAFNLSFEFEYRVETTTCQECMDIDCPHIGMGLYQTRPDFPSFLTRNSKNIRFPGVDFQPAVDTIYLTSDDIDPGWLLIMDTVEELDLRNIRSLAIKKDWGEDPIDQWIAYSLSLIIKSAKGITSDNPSTVFPSYGNLEELFIIVDNGVEENLETEKTKTREFFLKLLEDCDSLSFMDSVDLQILSLEEFENLPRWRKK